MFLCHSFWLRSNSITNFVVKFLLFSKFSLCHPCCNRVFCIDIAAIIVLLQVADIREEYSVWRCYESGSVPFFLQVIIFIYLILLQVVGIILAFQTRKVKINVLNDSKSVTTLIYSSSIVLVVIVLIKSFLRSYINVSAAVFSGGILLLATFFLILIFCPKVNSTYLILHI